MLLLNYDFYDIHSVLTMLRAKTEKEYNIEIVKAVLEYAASGDFQRLADLIDALHNIPIFFADGCKNFKRAVKIQCH